MTPISTIIAEHAAMYDLNADQIINADMFPRRVRIQFAVMRELRAEGYSDKDIGDAFGLKVESVHRSIIRAIELAG